MGSGGGGYRMDFPIPALCLLSQILLGERSFDLILGDSFSCKETYITVAKLSEKASCAEC